MESSDVASFAVLAGFRGKGSGGFQYFRKINTETNLKSKGSIKKLQKRHFYLIFVHFK